VRAEFYFPDAAANLKSARSQCVREEAFRPAGPRAAAGPRPGMQILLARVALVQRFCPLAVIESSIWACRGIQDLSVSGSWCTRDYIFDPILVTETFELTLRLIARLHILG
jgi:hypothetical protein